MQSFKIRRIYDEETFLLFSMALFSGVSHGDWNALLNKEVQSRVPSARIEIQGLRVTLPPGKGMRVGSFSPEVPLGLVSFEVEANGKRGQGFATVRAYASIAVAQVPISNGEALGPSNLRFEERELSRVVQSGYFLTLSTIGDRKARGYLSVGQAVSRNNSALPFLITAGQTVDLVRQKGNLKLVAKVRALQGGQRDQWIQVQNTASGKMLLGRIAGPSEVQIQ